MAKRPNGKITSQTTSKPSYTPLTETRYPQRPLPTISFAIDLNIPDDAFKYAEKKLAELTITDTEPCIEVKQAD